MSTELSPRARRRAATEQRIMDAALAMIVEGGADALSMHKLAEAVDYTVGALYRYFASKDALLAALGVAVLDELAGRLAAAVSDAGQGLAPVWGAVLCYRRYALEAPNRFGLLSQMLNDQRHLLADDGLAQAVLAASVRTLAPVVQALTHAPLPPDDANRRALVLFAGVQGALQLRKQARRLPQAFGDPDALLCETVRTLMLGWGAEPTAIDAAATAAGFPGAQP
ncbi:MAG: TetR/AcrR family transcriptional regulator [Myxococcales bacterium]|nr:TetR/AcrR family transcriptional regulator [Myxococcales bacterium]MCB9524292.1 TetR/AcrR family transcriptional regulator [Myxococcales bacterium]